MAEQIVVHGEHEYRRKDGQFLRRVPEKEKGWLVLDHGEEVPAVVKSQFEQVRSNMRFD